MAIPSINMAEYREQYYDPKADHLLVDVRAVSEYNEGHLPQAVNIPMEELNDRLDEVNVDKPIIMVCASGNRSGMVVEAMVNAGYDNVYNLQGGTMNWMMLGLPLEHSE